MKIYLDIDGVLLANEDNLSEGAAEFIKFAVDNFDVYWLTTHCRHGDPNRAIEYVQRTTNENLRPWLEKIKPVVWDFKKTEAIDFSQSFLWFDDDCYVGEREELYSNAVFDSWIEVDLYKHPNQLKHEIKLLESLLD